MRTFGRFLGRALLVLLLAAAGLWFLGPYERISLVSGFDPASVGTDVEAYFDAREARVEGITPGVEKRVVWAGTPGARTKLSVVYVHGFSATSEELRPVPDRVAAALGANLIYTRLTGHGRDGTALAGARVQDWADDLAEALAAARLLGDEVVIIATSTGATLVAGMADQAEVMQGVEGVILVSPNFAINNPLAPLLTLPAARHWVPLVGGRHRSWTPQNEGHARYWTTSYPSVAVFQMAAMVKAVRGMDLGRVTVPALFWFSDADQVVDAGATRDVAARWGGPVTLAVQSLGDGTDPSAHVIAGDILSPGMTEVTIEEFIKYIKGLE